MLKKIFVVISIFVSLNFAYTASTLAAPAPTTPTTCSQNVTTFAAYKRCATGSGMDFLEASYKCASFDATQTISRGYCVNYYDLYQSAVDSCKNVCVTPSASVPVTSSTPPSAPPACRAQELTTYKFDGACPVMVDNKPQYNFIDYKCGDETTYRRMGSSTSCQWGSSLIDGAQFYCRKNSCVVKESAGPIPSITPSPSPSPTPIKTSVPSVPPSASPRPSSTPVPTATSCAKNLGSWTFKEPCNSQPLSYRNFEYQCTGDKDFVSLGSPTTCNSESTWRMIGREACSKAACATSMPTQSPKATLKSIVKNPPALCAVNCYVTKWSSKSRTYCLDVCRGI